MLKTRLPLRPVSRAGQGQGSPGSAGAASSWRAKSGLCSTSSLAAQRPKGATGDLGQQEAGAHCETASLPWGLGVASRAGGKLRQAGVPTQRVGRSRIVAFKKKKLSYYDHHYYTCYYNCPLSFLMSSSWWGAGGSAGHGHY